MSDRNVGQYGRHDIVKDGGGVLAVLLFPIWVPLMFVALSFTGLAMAIAALFGSDIYKEDQSNEGD